jgi:hypothetical protein
MTTGRPAQYFAGAAARNLYKRAIREPVGARDHKLRPTWTTSRFGRLVEWALLRPQVKEHSDVDHG